MPAKITVIANCQSSPVANLMKYASSAVEICSVPPVHTLPKENPGPVLDIVRGSDIVVHQPIGAGFGPVSTEALKSEFPDKTFVSFPSIFFAGVLPHLAYLRKPGGGTLSGPIDEYHDLRILSAYLKGQSPAACLEGIEDMLIDFQAHFDTCMTESLRREAGLDIPVMNLIETRIRETQVTYTFNHVDNEILWHVATSALRILGLPHDGIQAAPLRLMLGGVIAAVPASLTTALGFGWTSDSYVLRDKRQSMPELIRACYEVYASTDNLDALLNHNRTRFSLAI